MCLLRFFRPSLVIPLVAAALTSALPVAAQGQKPSEPNQKPAQAQKHKPKAKATPKPKRSGARSQGPDRAALGQKATPSTSGSSHRPITDGPVAYGNRPAVRALAKALASERQLPEDWVLKHLQQAKFLPRVPQWVLPAASGTAKNWRSYRARFVEARRIEAGLAFWKAHESWLQQAEQRYGVPPWLVVGVLGVETLYGQQMGRFRVLDALATLTLDFPSNHPRAEDRQRYFRGELGQYLSNQHQAQRDPSLWLGSYAGAVGMPQFMPSSISRFAVDFDGDGRIDLFQSPADVVGSVAHYFQAHGWTAGQATHWPIDPQPLRPDQLDGLLAPDILPSFAPAALAGLGLELPSEAQNHQGKLALVELHNGDTNLTGNAPSYWLGTENFYVVTRYNWSAYYAMAVIDLGLAVQSAKLTASDKN